MTGAHQGWRPLLTALILACATKPPFGLAAEHDVLPREPVAIGTTPQFVFDNYIVDNYWALKYKRESVTRVFHPPVKHEANPVIPGQGGHGSVLRDEESGLFRLWYQTWDPSLEPGKSGRYAIAYAESPDGVHWELPELGLFEWKGSRRNNVVWTGVRNRRASGGYLLDVPREARRGYRHVMLYRETDGMHLIGSDDGIHWDPAGDVLISPIHSDTHNSIVYDARREEYVMYCRAKHIYRTFRGDVLDTGASRRIARTSSKELWTLWRNEPQNILIPDELDHQSYNFFYGMPTHVYAGIDWGFLWAFKMNTDIHTELCWSRDGIRFERLPRRPRLLDLGPQGAWDDGMVFGGFKWGEVGDAWWLYYTGWDGPHESKERTPGIGLATIRKEGLISMHGPPSGGVIVTRKILWPGGPLVINADASEGEIRVRVSDARRKVLPGFDYEDCQPFTGDSTAHEVAWKAKSIESLSGEVIRLEFLLRSADLYTFRAGPTGVDLQ